MIDLHDADVVDALVGLEQFEPTEDDYRVARECLLPVPWSRSPVQQLGRIIARYRHLIETQRPDRAVVGE